MLQCIMSACAIVAVMSSTVGAQQTPTFGRLILPDSIRFVHVFSGDQQVGTMIFDNFVVATEIGKGSLPSVVQKEFTYVLHPVTTKDAKVKQWIRGFVITESRSSAFAVVHAGGQTTLVDFKKAREAANAGTRIEIVTHEPAKKLAREQGMKVDQKREGEFGDILIEVESVVHPGVPLQCTIVLHVDRLPGEKDSAALLAIDTIDCAITDAAK